MSKMKCLEEVYDVLAAAGLREDHVCFDDLIYGCVALACGEANTDVVSYLEELDNDRDGTAIALDIYAFVRESGSKERPSAIIARAIAAGRVGWEQ